MTTSNAARYRPQSGKWGLGDHAITAYKTTFVHHDGAYMVTRADSKMQKTSSEVKLATGSSWDEEEDKLNSLNNSTQMLSSSRKDFTFPDLEASQKIVEENHRVASFLKTRGKKKGKRPASAYGLGDCGVSEYKRQYMAPTGVENKTYSMNFMDYVMKMTEPKENGTTVRATQ